MRSIRTAHKIAAFWEPSFVLPIQWKAKFEDAWQSVVRTASDRRGRQRREFREASDWFLDEGRSWPFAFLNVCELLAFDPNAVRQALRDHLAAQGQQEHRDALTPPTPSEQPTARRQKHVTTLERFAILGWDEA
jgi:hypothetical protein